MERSPASEISSSVPLQDGDEPAPLADVLLQLHCKTLKVKEVKEMSFYARLMRMACHQDGCEHQRRFRELDVWCDFIGPPCKTVCTRGNRGLRSGIVFI